MMMIMMDDGQWMDGCMMMMNVNDDDYYYEYNK